MFYLCLFSSIEYASLYDWKSKQVKKDSAVKYTINNTAPSCKLKWMVGAKIHKEMNGKMSIYATNKRTVNTFLYQKCFIFIFIMNVK